MFPLLYLCILRIAEYTLGGIDKGAGVNGVAELLVVEWYAYDVNRLKPFFYFSFLAFTDVD